MEAPQRVKTPQSHAYHTQGWTPNPDNPGMEWLAFERFAATWKDYEAAYGYQEMFYWKMGRAGTISASRATLLSVRRGRGWFYFRFLVASDRLRASSRDSVRNGSNWDQGPPIFIIDGHESRRWRGDHMSSSQVCASS